MDRLTKRVPGGHAWYNHQPGKTVSNDDLLERLAAYEDTGLGPEEVKDMAENAETRLLTWFEAKYSMPVGQLMAFLDACKESRLIVLPCKVGDTVYIIEPRFYNYTKHEGVQRGVCQKFAMLEERMWEVWVSLEDGEPHTLYAYNFSKFGKTVFLTREEAEAALEGRSNHGDQGDLG